MERKFDAKSDIYTKEHFSYFTVDELAAAYELFYPRDEARQHAEYECANADGRVLTGDMFAAIATVSPDAAKRMADLLEEPLEYVLAWRDDLLTRLGRVRESPAQPGAARRG